MFDWFRNDPKKKLEKAYARKLVEALEAQRRGKIPQYAELTAEAEAIGQRLDALKANA